MVVEPAKGPMHIFFCFWALFQVYKNSHRTHSPTPSLLPTTPGVYVSRPHPIGRSYASVWSFGKSLSDQFSWELSDISQKSCHWMSELMTQWETDTAQPFFFLTLSFPEFKCQFVLNLDSPNRQEEVHNLPLGSALQVFASYSNYLVHNIVTLVCTDWTLLLKLVFC